MNAYHPIKINRIKYQHGLAIIAVVFFAGCASTPAPKAEMAVARTAVNSAMSSGGNEVAPVRLKSAMDKMDAADKAMADKNYKQARQLAEQAEVDANLVAETARTDKAQKAAAAIKSNIGVLRNELDNKDQ